MKNAILLILMIIFLACDNENKNNDAFVVDTVVQITLKNEKGDDLLNPSTAGTYNTNKIKIYYVDKQGNSKEYYESNLDNPKGYFIFQNEGEYKIKIFPNDDLSISNPLTVIKWNDEESDELKCEIQRTSNRTICTKVWVNNLLMYSDYSKERIVDLIK